MIRFAIPGFSFFFFLYRSFLRQKEKKYGKNERNRKNHKDQRLKTTQTLNKLTWW